MTRHLLSRAVAAFLAACVILQAPGLGCYEALAAAGRSSGRRVKFERAAPRFKGFTGGTLKERGRRDLPFVQRRVSGHVPEPVAHASAAKPWQFQNPLRPAAVSRPPARGADAERVSRQMSELVSGLDRMSSAGSKARLDHLTDKIFLGIPSAAHTGVPAVAGSPVEKISQARAHSPRAPPAAPPAPIPAAVEKHRITAGGNMLVGSISFLYMGLAFAMPHLLPAVSVPLVLPGFDLHNLSFALYSFGSFSTAPLAALLAKFSPGGSPLLIGTAAAGAVFNFLYVWTALSLGGAVKDYLKSQGATSPTWKQIWGAAAATPEDPGRVFAYLKSAWVRATVEAHESLHREGFGEWGAYSLQYPEAFLSRAPYVSAAWARVKRFILSASQIFFGDPEVRPFVKKYPFFFWTGLTLLLTDAVIGNLLPNLTRLLMQSAQSRSLEGVVMMMWTIPVVSAFYALLEFAHSWASLMINANVIYDFRVWLMRHFVGQSHDFFINEKPGELTSRLLEDTSKLSTRNVHVPMAAPHYFGVLALSLGMFAAHAPDKMTYAILGLMVFVSAFGYFVGKKLEKLTETYAKEKADLTAQTQEAFSNPDLFKSYGNEDLEVERFSRRALEMKRLNVKIALLRAIEWSIKSATSTFATIYLIYLWGSYSHVVSGSPGIPDMIGMVGWAGGIKYAVDGVISLVVDSLEAGGATQKVVKDYPHRVPSVRDSAAARELGVIEGRVDFKDVVFSYSKEPFLKEVSFSALPGQVTAIVGGSGGGKTTILRLLQRFYDVEKGGVWIDGYDIREVSQKSFRKQFALVPQNAKPLMGTIRENITYGKPGATEAEIQSAVRSANAEFIYELPNGMDTVVGTNGGNISGGQAQRIAIARAILRNPRILILDEATSALDNKSEKAVQSALDNLMKGRTTFVVAHRLTTIQRADRILVLDGGQIVQAGTHAELLKDKDGKYYGLYTAAQGPHNP